MKNERLSEEDARATAKWIVFVYKLIYWFVFAYVAIYKAFKLFFRTRWSWLTASVGFFLRAVGRCYFLILIIWIGSSAGNSTHFHSADLPSSITERLVRCGNCNPYISRTCSTLQEREKHIVGHKFRQSRASGKYNENRHTHHHLSACVWWGIRLIISEQC